MKPHVFIGPVLVAVVVLLTGVAMAGAPPTPNLLDRLIALEARVTALETELAAIKSSPVMALNNYLTVTTGDKPRARFSGLNLQVVNGTGYTGFVNGLGNVIIGYDEQRPWSPTQEYCSSGEFGDQGSCENAGHTWASNHKSGSHYLVVGEYNNYSQYAGVVAGLANTSNAPYAIAIGGYGNVASRVYATVLGGSSNTASGQNATVTAGQNNVASAYATSVTGGWFNRASGLGSSVSGGNLNTASGGGLPRERGQLNTASGDWASVSGGAFNTASRAQSSVSGGMSNTASGLHSSVSGGYQRSTTGEWDWVAGELFQEQ